MTPQRKRVLFIAEDITLAQVVRLNVLARSLDPAHYDVHFACAHFPELVFQGSTFTRHLIFSLDRKKVFGKLERGGRLYDRRVLARYVRDELALFEHVRPDLVVGDLRLSLSVSAPVHGVPHASLINAYWSKHMVREQFPLPDHPIVRLLGERLAARYFPQALPRVFAHFAAPVNALRRAYGLAPLGDLIDVLLSGERVLFPDVPYLTPLAGAPAHHVFLGAVQWSPELPVPAGWDGVSQGQHAAYVTLGSSGRVDRLPTVLAGLAPLDLTMLVATAGRGPVLESAPGLFAADYLPGAEAARRARFVVCNGGSSTAYQALAEGKPVLGICSNLDQYLAMSAIEARGAGILLRASTVTRELVLESARKLLCDERYTQAAERAARELGSYDCHGTFAHVLRSLWPREPAFSAPPRRLSGVSPVEPSGPALEE